VAGFLAMLQVIDNLDMAVHIVHTAI